MSCNLVIIWISKERGRRNKETLEILTQNESMFKSECSCSKCFVSNSEDYLFVNDLIAVSIERNKFVNCTFHIWKGRYQIPEQKYENFIVRHVNVKISDLYLNESQIVVDLRNTSEAIDNVTYGCFIEDHIFNFQLGCITSKGDNKHGNLL